MALVRRSSWLVMPARPILAALTLPQTHSSGLSCGDRSPFRQARRAGKKLAPHRGM